MKRSSIEKLGSGIEGRGIVDPYEAKPFGFGMGFPAESIASIASKLKAERARWGTSKLAAQCGSLASLVQRVPEYTAHLSDGSILDVSINPTSYDLRFSPTEASPHPSFQISLLASEDGASSIAHHVAVKDGDKTLALFEWGQASYMHANSFSGIHQAFHAMSDVIDQAIIVEERRQLYGN